MTDISLTGDFAPIYARRARENALLGSPAWPRHDFVRVTAALRRRFGQRAKAETSDG